MTGFRLLAAACAALFALAIGAQGANAQALDRILKDKKIRITAEVTSPPFGILDKDNKPTGSEIETARQLAKDLGVELELVQVTGPQRIPALLSDRADLAISSLSITTDRAKTVMFSSPHGALSIVIGAFKDMNIKSAADLAGKKIGMTRATLEEQVVPKVAPPGTNIVFFDEHSATQQALLSGQVDAIGGAAFLINEMAKRNPDKGIETEVHRDDGVLRHRREAGELRPAAMGQHLGVREQAERRAGEDLQGEHRRRSGGSAAVVVKVADAPFPLPRKAGEGGERMRGGRGPCRSKTRPSPAASRRPSPASGRGESAASTGGIE